MAQWSPPSYAIAKKDNEWTPPSYATAVENKEDDELTLNKVIDKVKGALTPSKGFNPKDDIVHRAIGSASKFLGEHPSIREHARHFLEGPSKEETGGYEILGPGLEKVPGMEELGNKIRNAGTRTGNYWLGAAGSVVGDIISGLSVGFDPRAAGVKEAQVSATQKALGEVAAHKNIAKSTPQRDTVAIALTKEGVPRTPANISTETGIPQPSVRRNMSELRKQGIKSEEEKLADYLKSNKPTRFNKIAQEAVAAEKEHARIAQDPYEFAGESIDLPEIKHRDFGYSERDSSNKFPELKSEDLSIRRLGPGRVEPPTTEVKPTAEFKFDWPDVGGKQYQIEGGPYYGSTVGEAKLKELGIDVPPEKPKFVNPFEKPKIGEVVENKAPKTMADHALDAANDMEKAGDIEGANKQRETIANMLREEGHKSWGDNISPSEEPSIRQPNLPAEFTPVGEEDIFNATRPKQKLKTVEEWTPPSYAKVSEAERDAAYAKPEAITEEIKPTIESSGEEWKPPEYAKSVESPIAEAKPLVEEPPGLATRATTKLQEFEDFARTRIKERGTFSGGRLLSGLPTDDLADLAIIGSTKIARGFVRFADWSAEMISNFGESIRPHLKEIFKASKEHHGEFTGGAVKKLFNSLVEAKGANLEQQGINTAERARRFAEFEKVKKEGAAGAAESLSKLKGEFEKTNPGEGLDLDQDETNMLFTTIKRSNLDTPEKARAYTAMYALLNGDRVPQKNELAILDKVFGKYMKKVSGPGASGGYDIASGSVPESFEGIGEHLTRQQENPLTKTANTMKALMYSSDMSFGLRQGLGMIHKPEWRSAMKEQFKYLADPEHFREAQEAIKAHPKYQQAIDSGLFLADTAGSLTSGEERFMNNYVGKLPMGAKGLYTRNIVDASERAYVGGLNKLRMDLYNNLTTLAGNLGHDVEKISPNIAKYINVFTGRGGLGQLEKIKGTMNFIFGSPRMLSSRLTALNPKFYWDLDSFTKREAIKSLLAVAAASTTLNTLGAVMGGKVSMDIMSSDFMKTRFASNNVLDPSGSFQQPIVAAARMIGELNRMASGRKLAPNERTIPQIGADFLTNKLSPIVGLGYEIAMAKQFTGKGNYIDRFGNKKNMLSETGKRFVSIFSQDMYDLLSKDPSFAEAVGLPPLMLLGAGEQNYPERKPGKSQLLRKLSP